MHTPVLQTQSARTLIQMMLDVRSAPDAECAEYMLDTALADVLEGEASYLDAAMSLGLGHAIRLGSAGFDAADLLSMCV